MPLSVALFLGGIVILGIVIFYRHTIIDKIGNAITTIRIRLKDRQMKLGDGAGKRIATAHVTGMTDDEGKEITEKVLEEKKAELNAIGFAVMSLTRIAWAHKAEQFEFGDHRRVRTAEEEDYGAHRINRIAAYAILTDLDLTDLDLVEEYADTGLQTGRKGDPVLASYGLDGSINLATVRENTAAMKPEELRGLDLEVILAAADLGNPVNPAALEALRAIDTDTMCELVSDSRGKKFTTTSKADQLYSFCQSGALSDDGRDHAQHDKELAVIKAYELARRPEVQQK